LFLQQDLADGYEADDREAGLRRHAFQVRPGISPRTRRCLVLFLVFALAAVVYIVQSRLAEESLVEETCNAAAKSALRQLAMAQENHYAETNTYAGSLGDLAGVFKPKSTIRINILRADRMSWAATARHRKSRTRFLFESNQTGFQGKIDRKLEAVGEGASKGASPDAG